MSSLGYKRLSNHRPMQRRLVGNAPRDVSEKSLGDSYTATLWYW